MLQVKSPIRSWHSGIIIAIDVEGLDEGTGDTSSALSKCLKQRKT